MTRIRHSDLLACERALSRITSSASFECKELHQLAILKSKSTATNFNSRLYFEELVKRRLDMREPLQYIVGEWDFSVLKNITVRPPVLIPRPETEELVRLVEEYFLESTNVENRLLEIGIGSGAISISLLTLFNKLEALGVDLSNDACELTKENAIKFNVSNRLSILQEDVFNWIEKNDISSSSSSSRPFSVLVSNPPYIPDDEMEDGLDPEIKNWESQDALRGGKPLGLGFTLRLLQSFGKQSPSSSSSLSSSSSSSSSSPFSSSSSSIFVHSVRAFFELHWTHPALLISILVPQSRGIQITLPPASKCGKGANVIIPSHDTVRSIISAEEEIQLQNSWKFISAYSDFNQKPRFIVLEKK